MKLAFKKKYRSIDQFDPVELPAFTVLTGVNGSGKTHLMTAIQHNRIVLDGLSNPHIVHFNYETFRLDNEAQFNGQQLSQECESAWQFFQQQVRGAVQQWRATLGNSYDDLKEECRKSRDPLWSNPEVSRSKYANQCRLFFGQDNYRENQQAQGIYSLIKRLPYGIDEIDRATFTQLYKPFVFKHDFLPLQLGKVFWDYYVKYRSNQVNEFQNEKYGKNYDAMSEEEFISLQGPKPWDAVNDILNSFDTLKYEVTSPEGLDYFGNFKLKLQHILQKDLEIEFSDLSSGERVLMALVASVYKSSSDRHFPDVLLLDEVDASLHPSMMKNMLDVIDRVFLNHGVNVILVTHSPTTIALCPEDSIFVVNRIGPKRIEKKSRQDALSILTEGFATIEEGLKLFDEVCKSNLTIVSEGYNTRLIKAALALHGVGDVDVLSGVEGSSGKSQLKTLFQFFSKVRHDKKVVFVWDCDAALDLVPENNTFPYVFERNEQNSIVKKGIENAFPKELFAGFCKTITRSRGQVITEFDEARKRDFQSFVLDRNNKDDFAHFASLVDEVNRIRSL